MRRRMWRHQHSYNTFDYVQVVHSNFEYEMTNYDAYLSRAAWSSADCKLQSGQVTSKPLYSNLCQHHHYHQHHQEWQLSVQGGELQWGRERPRSRQPHSGSTVRAFIKCFHCWMYVWVALAWFKSADPSEYANTDPSSSLSWWSELPLLWTAHQVL